MLNQDSRSPKPPNRRLKLTVLLVLLATVSINLLSAYIRHLESGLDCADWPACYGLIGSYVEPAADQTVAQMALAPVAAAKKVHRGVATLLVIMVLLLVVESRKQQGSGGVNRNLTANLPYIMAAILLLLSVVGPASYMKTLPAIAVVNLVGGMTLMALSGWLWLQLAGEPPVANSGLKPLARVGLVLLVLQIVLGIWLSANFAAISCSGLWACEPLAEAVPAVGDSFWYFRELRLDESGRVLFDQGMQTIHIVHRIGALLIGLVLLALALLCVRRGDALRRNGLALGVLVLLQLALGASAIIMGLPLILVLGHNLTAALLLLMLVKLNYLAR
jgi:cytochrome c oxidase assembly protein subunit 15